MKYRFASCELDTKRHELMLDGTVVDIEPQVFDLLVYMLENRSRLITHDDLIQAVWRSRVVSDSAIAARISAARRAVGDSGSAQEVIKTIPRKGFKFVAEVRRFEGGQQHTDSGAVSAASSVAGRDGHQVVRFCRSADGARIAFAKTGSGPPLVRAGHWLTHLEHDWHSPIWRPFLDELGAQFSIVRYDQRGNGLSDWDVTDFSFHRFVEDLEAVVDEAGLERFVLYGTSQGAPIAIAYAVSHPEKVSRLILHGGYVQGRLVRQSEAEKEQGEAILKLIEHGWGKSGSPFLKAFTTMYIPNGTREQMDSLVALQRLTTKPDNAVRIRRAVDQFDVSDLLAQVSTPTLVTHARDDGVHPLDQGRALAAGIKHSEFVLLESDNHAILPQEPAWGRFFEELKRFA